MAGGYWHISDRILKRGNDGYDFIGTTPFVSINNDTNEFELNAKVILLDIKETSITLDGTSGKHIIAPVYLESRGFSAEDNGFVYVGKTSSSAGIPVDLTAYVYIGMSDDLTKVSIIAIDFEGTTNGGGDNNN